MDHYPLPYLSDSVANLEGCKHFTTLDLVKSYHQIKLAPEDRVKTALATPVGSFQFCSLAMGLKNAAQSFQRLMDSIFRDLPFVFVYIDDILIASETQAQHLQHLKTVFSRLHQHGLTVNKEKCVFNSESVQFLGHFVNSEGIRPMDSKVEAIKNFKTPSSMKELRQLLGMINFYRKFIPHCAEILKPLTDMLSPKVNSTKKINFNAKAHEAFSIIKEKLAEASLLTFPKLNAQTMLYVDASDISVGGALVQLDSKETPSPLAFYSKNLNTAQQKYSVFDRELLAVFLAVRHFRYFLEGRQFTIYTDHKPIVAAMSATLKDATPRQARQLSFVSQFSTDLKWIKGSDNVVADCLSRLSKQNIHISTPPIEPEKSPSSNEIAQVNMLFNSNSCIDYEKLAREQENDPQLEQLKSRQTNLKIISINLPGSHTKIWGDISKNNFRPFITLNFRKLVFQKLHELSHPGVKATQKLVAERFFWTSLKKDIKLWSETCIACQKAKVARHNQAALQNFCLPRTRFETVHIDILGPLNESSGFSYLLTMIDRFSRWVECVPLSSITSKNVFENFLLHWVSRFGVPLKVITDRGGQFVSGFFSDMCEFLNIELLHTTSFHPQTNGAIERFHRSLKVSLRTHENSSDWFSNLGYVLLGLRASLKPDLGCSIAELAFGIRLRLPGELFLHKQNPPLNNYTQYKTNLVNFLNTLQTPIPRDSNSREEYINKLLNTCTHVFIRQDGRKPPLQNAYTGPFAVLSRSPKYFTVLINQKCDHVSIDRLKPAKLLICSSLEPENSPSLHCSDNNIDLDNTNLFEDQILHSTPENNSFSTDTRHDTVDNQNTTLSIQTRLGRKIIKPLRFRKSL